MVAGVSRRSMDSAWFRIDSTKNTSVISQPNLTLTLILNVFREHLFCTQQAEVSHCSLSLTPNLSPSLQMVPGAWGIAIGYLRGQG